MNIESGPNIIEQPKEEPKYEQVEFNVAEGKTEKVKCEVVDLNSESYNKSFESAEWYKKSVEIQARQAEKDEEIKTDLDATKNVAKIGDWVVTNPGGERYVIRAEKFSKLYEAKEKDPGVFISKGAPVRGVQTEKDITFFAPWGEKQSVRAGGYVLENGKDRYGIDAKAFADTYKKVEIPKEEKDREVK